MSSGSEFKKYAEGQGIDLKREGGITANDSREQVVFKLREKISELAQGPITSQKTYMRLVLGDVLRWVES